MLEGIGVLIRFPFFLVGFTLWTLIWPILWIINVVLLPLRFIVAALQNEVQSFACDFKEQIVGLRMVKDTYSDINRWLLR